jgi:hypothetical protein
MKVKALKAACLAVGLVTAWGGAANAGPSQSTDEIQLTITPSNNLSHVYFLYGVNSSTLNAVTAVPLPNLVGGISTTETFNVNHTPFADAFVVIGLYDETNKLLTVAMNSSEAQRINGNTDFADEFSQLAIGPFYSEDAIATAMLSNDTVTIANAFENEDGIGFTVNLGDSGSLVNFSNASEGGSVSAEVIVPEPSSIELLCSGMLAILAFHRKWKDWLLPTRKRISDQQS